MGLCQNDCFDAAPSRYVRIDECKVLRMRQAETY